jgi:hypothetical protein
LSGTTIGPEHQHHQQEPGQEDGADEDGELVGELGGQVVGHRGQPGDRGVGRQRVTDPLQGGRGGLVGRDRRGQDRQDDRVAGRGGRRRTDRGDARDVGEALGERTQVCLGRAVAGQVDDHEQRTVDPGAERVTEQVVGAPVAGGGRVVAGVREAGLQAQRRGGEGEQHDRAGSEPGPRAAGDPVGEAPPGRVLERRGRLDGSAGQAQVSAIDAVAEQGQERRQQGERGGDGDDDDERDGQADAGQEADADEQQREHRQHDGAAGEGRRQSRPRPSRPTGRRGCPVRPGGSPGSGTR